CGVADSEAGVIAVKAPELLPPGGDVTGTLRHELVHVLLARNVRIDRMPRWLNEGIAMTQAREYRWESGFRVAQMYFQNRLLTYDALELSFLEPGREMEFGDAYAQALSMTRFLKDELGEERFWRVVSGLNTATFPEALEQHGSMSLEELSEAWRGSLWQVALVFSIVSGFSIFQVMAVLTIMAYLRKRRQGRLRMRRWEEEDAEDDRFPPFMTVRELEDQDGPYPWEEDEDGGYL
ncbi:MAG: hypothetical protein JXR94_02870, partial [Candidatus Hydrogenedentes bacterium]|nr:hypothetical protein [Candidatus Hydrogenedentota bacterium]